MTQNVYASTDNHKQCSAHLFKMLVPADNTPPPCVALSELTLPSHIHTTPCYPKLHTNAFAAEQAAQKTPMVHMNLENYRQHGTATGPLGPFSFPLCIPHRGDMPTQGQYRMPRATACNNNNFPRIGLHPLISTQAYPADKTNSCGAPHSSSRLQVAPALKQDFILRSSSRSHKSQTIQNMRTQSVY